MGALTIIFLPIAFLGITALFLVMTFGDRRFVPRMVQYGALAWLFLSIAMGVSLAILTLVQTETTIETSLMPAMPSTDIPGMTVEISPPATIVSADALWATYTVTDLSWWPRSLYALSIALQSLISGYLSWIIYSTARNLRGGSPFTGISQHLIRFGIVLFLASLVTQLAEALGNAFAGSEALTISGYSYDGDDPEILSMISDGVLPFPDWPVQDVILGEISLAPIGFAMVLVLLGMVFAVGEKLADDTEGLV